MQYIKVESPVVFFSVSSILGTNELSKWTITQRPTEVYSGKKTKSKFWSDYQNLFPPKVIPKVFPYLFSEQIWEAVWDKEGLQIYISETRFIRKNEQKWQQTTVIYKDTQNLTQVTQIKGQLYHIF